MKNKRAVSALIATVLLILITVAAIGIIWGVVYPMIKKNMQVSESCLNARIDIDTERGYTCFNNNTKELEFMISRGEEKFYLEGMKISLFSGGTSKAIEIKQKNYTNIRELSGKYGQKISLPKESESRTYVVNISNFGLKKISEITVRPIIKIGNTEKVCDVPTRATIDYCA